jgi:hypothetical protein
MARSRGAGALSTAQLHGAREALEELETDFFQILYLAGKRRLCHAQSTRCAAKMLFLANRHEIAQVPQFHSNTLSRLV